LNCAGLAAGALSVVGLLHFVRCRLSVGCASRVVGVKPIDVDCSIGAQS
jgi:hypothetical protein